MKVVSKFLTADVEIVAARLEGGKVVIEGMIKGFMPMRVETDLADFVKMILVASQPIRERLAAHLPERLGALVRPVAPVVANP